jgi:hypothetical protein
MICPLHAWGDESIRSHGLEAPAYLLGASVVDTEDLPATRAVLDGLRPTKGKLHWHDLDASRRDEVGRVVGSLAAEHLVVIASPTELRRQERARAVCLRHLIWELDRSGVDGLTLEARPATLMNRDRRVVDGLRAQRAVAPRFRLTHGFPDGEPMLWLPDQVIGIVGATLLADDRRWADLQDTVRIVRLDTPELAGPSGQRSGSV